MATPLLLWYVYSSDTDRKQPSDCQREHALAMVESGQRKFILINIYAVVPRKFVGVTCFDYHETSHRKWQIISCIQRRKSVTISAIYLGIT